MIKHAGGCNLWYCILHRPRFGELKLLQKRWFQLLVEFLLCLFIQSKKSLRLREKGYQPIPNIPYNIDSICISIYNLYWISSFTQCFWLFWFYSFFLGPTLGPWTRWARNGTSCLTRASPHGWLEGRLGPNEVENSMQGLKHSLIDLDFQFFHLLSLSRLINFASSLVSHHPRTCCQQPWCRHQGGRRHVAERSARRCADLGDLRFRHLVVRLKCSFQHRKKLHVVGKFLKHVYLLNRTIF